MAIAYYGVKLSKNLAETPEGYLVFKNAVIARTGMQKYRGAELPQRAEDTPAEEVTAQDLGIQPDDMVELYRDAEEVFHSATIASFEGKVITDGHPEELVSVDTHGQLACGHIQNVRRGSELLEDGNFGLLADGVVTDPSLIQKIKSGLRELSCGYNYHVIKKGNRICMVDIIGNHVAVVPNARAGSVAAIKDSAPEGENTNRLEFSGMVKSEIKKMLVAMGFKAYAATADAKDLAIAMDAIGKDEHAADCKCSDCMPASKDAEPEKEVAVDAKANDRKSFHDALDKMLDDKESEAKAQESESDKAMDALKGLFAAKDEEPTDKREDANEGDVAGDEDPENEKSEEEEETEATDEAVQSEAAEVISPEDRPKPEVAAAVDAAYREGQKDILKALKPVFAASKDKAMRAAFDQAMKLTKDPVKTKGSYSAAAKAATTVAKDSIKDPVAEVNKIYADMRKTMLNAGKR